MNKKIFALLGFTARFQQLTQLIRHTTITMLIHEKLQIHIHSYHHRKDLHVARACGASERLGGVPTLGLVPLGLGEEGLGGAAIDSLVSELLC